ncbi:MAG TPA: NAD-dependent epimerase/dehydratase family protein [Polyangia bacterium]
MHVFVTGASGFIGSVVVRQLLARGHSVRAFLLPGSPRTRLANLAVEIAEGDVRDPASVERAMTGCQGVIHLASLSNWKDIDSPLMDAVVVEGTRHVLAAARKLGGVRVVYVSSALAMNGTNAPVMQDESSPCTMEAGGYSYTRAKRAAEALCQQAVKDGLAVMIVNPGEVYGPNDVERITAGNLIDFAKSSPVLVCDGGTAVVHVDDVAAGMIAALERGRPGERYILAGESLSVRAIAELTLEIMGKKKRVLEFPNPIVRGLAWLGRNLKLPLPFDPHVIPYATKYWFVSGAKAERELGVKFRSARETLTPTVRWLEESGALG